MFWTVQDAIGAGPYTSRQSEMTWILRGDAVESGGRWFRRKNDRLRWSHSGKVNRYDTDTDVRIWRTEQPHAQIEHRRDSPKVHIFSTVSREKVHGYFLSREQLWLATHFWTCWKTGCYPNWIPIMTITFYSWTELLPRPLHFHNNVRVLLPQRWIERAANWDNNLLRWPPRSPDLKPCDFFLWRFVRDNVYVLPLLTPLPGNSWSDNAWTIYRPLQRTCYTESGMSLIAMRMCIVWPKVHTLKDCN
jgi:hypothetical protein